MPVQVANLKEKLKALRELGEERLSREKLLKALGIGSDSTLRWYESGAATRAPGTIPDRAYQKLVDLMQKNLPGRRDRAQVVALVHGSAASLRSAFLSGSAVAWWNLVEQSGIRTGGRLIREPILDFGLVEVHSPDAVAASTDAITVALYERFHLAFAIPISGSRLILQLAQRTWAGVPFANGKFVVEGAPGEMFVPGSDGDGRQHYLVERRDLGRHRFVCVCSRQPFPASIQDALRHGSLERSCLDDLAGFYEAQAAGTKHLIILDLAMERAESPNPVSTRPPKQPPNRGA